METTSKQNEWARQVIDAINAIVGGSANMNDASMLVRDETGEALPDGVTSPFEFLAALRGDEPADAFENGDTAQDYADQLTTEWDLYGPEGE